MYPAVRWATGASQVVLDQLARQDEQPKDHLCYLTRTPDGKILKSSSLYIRNSRGGVVAHLLHQPMICRG